MLWIWSNNQDNHYDSSHVTGKERLYLLSLHLLEKAGRHNCAISLKDSCIMEQNKTESDSSLKAKLGIITHSQKCTWEDILLGHLLGRKEIGELPSVSCFSLVIVIHWFASGLEAVYNIMLKIIHCFKV